MWVFVGRAVRRRGVRGQDLRRVDLARRRGTFLPHPSQVEGRVDKGPQFGNRRWSRDCARCAARCALGIEGLTALAERLPRLKIVRQFSMMSDRPADRVDSCGSPHTEYETKDPK